MIGIKGTMAAEKCLELIDQTIKLYGARSTLDATDRASLIKKHMSLMEIEHQQCHAHGVHLAVTDLLSKPPQEQESVGGPIESHDKKSSNDYAATFPHKFSEE